MPMNPVDNSLMPRQVTTTATGVDPEQPSLEHAGPPMTDIPDMIARKIPPRFAARLKNRLRRL